MSTETLTAPSSQSVTAWKKKADKVLALQGALNLAVTELAAKLDLIRKAHEPGIAQMKAELATLSEEFEAFGVEHREFLFADGSTIETKVAEIIGSVSPPAVELGEGWDEAGAIAALEKDEETKGFVAIKKSLDKTALKKALSAGDKLAAKILKKGVGLAQGFSIKVKGKQV